MYPGRSNPVGSMPNPMAGGLAPGGAGEAMRGQYHVHQKHHHHHHHHQVLRGQASTGSLQGHIHSKHSSHHDRLGRGNERRHVVSSHSSPSLAIGGETPYMSHPQDTAIHGAPVGGGFVMGTDLHTSTSTASWYHDQPVTQVQPVTLAVSTPQAQTETIPKDSESYVFGEVKEGRASMGHKQPVTPLLQDGWKPSSIKCAVPKLYQPSSDATTKPLVMAAATEVTKSLDHPRDKDGNNLILHCIDLRHHIDELNAIIATLPSTPQDLAPSTLLQPTAPPKPSKFHTEPSTKQPHNPMLAPQEKLPEVQLDQTALHLLLRKSTAAICAHSGYEAASSRALDTLSDVLGNFLSNLCKLMRINADRLSETGSLAFQDVLDQSLHQCGLGGKAELHRYWKSTVKGYKSLLDGEVDELTAEYKKLTDPNRGKQKGSVPSSLHLQLGQDQDLRLPSLWPTAATPIDLVGGFSDEELTLDDVNLENVLPTRTPDLGGPGIEFTQFSDAAAQESEGFTPLTVDGPPRKRLRTMILEPPQIQ